MKKRREFEAEGDVGSSAEGSGAESVGRSVRGSRLAFALALTALMLGTFISFGGLSYAANATASAVHTLKQVSTGHKVVVQHSSASDQYAPPKQKQKQKFTPPAASKSGSTGQTGQAGTLPFTGLSLGGTALVSGVLLLLGILLRRRERRSS
jgi:hypothetical protein